MNVTIVTNVTNVTNVTDVTESNYLLPVWGGAGVGLSDKENLQEG
jgi:hypothetical protein